MSVNGNDAQGILQLVEKYKQDFRISENLNHYNTEDYRTAEKQYVKFCLKNGSALEAESGRGASE